MSADVNQWLNESIAAAKAGDEAGAKDKLARVVEHDPHNETAWLWLAALVDTDDELRICLENVLTINPANDTARARLAMLESAQAVTPAPEPVEPDTYTPALAPPAQETAAAQPTPLEIEPATAGCPYCGREIDQARACPHCHGRLVIESPKPSPFPIRPWMLAASWLLLAIIYGLMDLLTWSALKVLATPSQQGGPLARYTTDTLTSYVVNVGAIPDLSSGTLAMIFWLLACGEAVIVAWYLVIAIITPSRRPGIVPAAGLVVVPVGALLAVVEVILGFYPSLVKLVATVAVGFFLFTSMGDFIWERVRYTLALDRGLKTALDYYNRGRRYREQGMLANAILHWQQATTLEPNRVAFRIPLGNALYRAGRYREAGEHIRAALGGLAPDSPQAEDLRQFLERIQARLDANAS